MEFRIKNDPPSVTVTAAENVVDIGKERELRQLRSRVAELELQAVAFRGRVAPSLTPRNSLDEKHGYRCGFHPNVEVSLETPTVECKVCGEELDPIEVLREFATDERQFAQRTDSLIQQQKELQLEVDRLTRQRANLRAQVRRAGAKPIEKWDKDPDATRPADPKR